VFHAGHTIRREKAVKALASNIGAGVYNASMSRKRATSTSTGTSDSDPEHFHDSVTRDSAAKVVLRRGKARPLWFGHPWVYANAVDRVEGTADPGSVVSLLDHDGRFIGRGIYNSRSQIPVRLLTRSEETIDAAFFARRLRAAQALRGALALPSAETTAYRLVNSEGDQLPGLVVDVFGDAAAFQLSTLGMSLWREEIATAIEEVLAPKTIYEVAAGSFGDVEGFVSETRVVRGESRAQVPCLEDGIRLEAEPLQGQKTGLFLDQRPNRIRVGQIVRAAPKKFARVLDCYAYAGGFGLQAARGGAGEITAVDSSARAVARVEAHAKANGADIRAVESDTFRFLETATPRAYDLVVIDPPKFARARKDLEAAIKGYERLNALALTACAPGAVLVTCSCSQNVGQVEFERILAAGARQANREVRILECHGPGPDHPLPPGFGEGQYLKVLFVYVT
jgi:23S rRNA (cytosine1962-C5)-methyltransferase